MSAIVLSRMTASLAPRTRRNARRGNTNTALVVRGATQTMRQVPSQALVLAEPRRQRAPGRRNQRRRVPFGTPTTAPATYGLAMTGGAPRISASSTVGGCVVSHSEILDSPTGTTDFSVNRYAMVPNVFAWLNGLGANWSRFRWLSLRADYVTASPTSQGGTIALGATYDTPGELIESLSEMKALAHSFVGPVWQQAGLTQHSVVYDCQRWSKPYYSYNSGPARLPISYIPAFLQFGKQTQVNGQVIGHVVVSYTIEFLDPIPSRVNLLLDSPATAAAEAAAPPDSAALVVSTARPDLPPPREDDVAVIARGVRALLERAEREDEDDAVEADPSDLSPEELRAVEQ